MKRRSALEIARDYCRILLKDCMSVSNPQGQSEAISKNIDEMEQ